MDDNGTQYFVARSRALAKQLLPGSVVNQIRRLEHASRYRVLRDLESNEDIFSAVYHHGMWGGGRSNFYSGHGSHRSATVAPYIDVVSTFLESLPEKPSVVDLGCGDFSVGSQLRGLCDRYIACDVVPDLIERNRKLYKDYDVDFRHLDVAREDLPRGEVAFLREVLQHLDNRSIKTVVDRLTRYRYVVVTELVPAQAFVPNLDKPAGFDVRLAHGSGVDITQPPFSLDYVGFHVLLEQDFEGAKLRVVLFVMT
jgi:hypothetical protein